MQDLFQKLKDNYGLTPEQTYGILHTIKEYVKEKFPMVGGSLDNLFPPESKGTDTDTAQAAAGSTPAGDTGTTEGPESKGGSFLDSASDVTGKEAEKEKQAAKDKVNNSLRG